ncbi:hypothetical protein [Parasediminibacterium sp. JCM 36343]|uniref:hypothetical protein n=1 Tax=Parasediminibacterium sp. JCM 36343 TaxID=3374279 RepID=UPI00397B86AA
MLAGLKMNVALIAAVGIIITATITAPFTMMFGKHYEASKDFSCCKNDQLVLHHYYTVNVLWVTVADGYTEEETGKQAPGGCVIRCIY